MPVNNSLWSPNGCLVAQERVHLSLFPITQSHTAVPFDIVHSDVWECVGITSRLGFHYYATFIDHTYNAWVYFLHTKDEVLLVFKKFYQYVSTQLNKHIKTVHSDSWGEYKNNVSLSYLSEKGIVHQYPVLIIHDKIELQKERIGIL